jgi:hypothetical protein
LGIKKCNANVREEEVKGKGWKYKANVREEEAKGKHGKRKCKRALEID